MNLSVVILTSNQCELTMRCLESIKGLIGRECYEIVLVDNGSCDDTVGKVRGKYPAVKYIPLPQNEGVAKGRNRGVKAAGGDLIMLLDNDTVASPEMIEAMKAQMESDPDIGVLAPRLVDRDGRTQASFKDFPGLGLKMRNWLSDRNNDYAESYSKGEPFYVIGAAQMFRKDLFEELGGLDENIFFGPEDADFCIRVRKKGLKVVYDPEYVITHDWQRSTSGRKLTRRAWLHAKALIYFYLKHRRFW